MKSKVVTKKLIIMGLDFYGDPFSIAGEWSQDNSIGLLWKMFHKRLQKSVYKSNTNVDHSLYCELHQFDEDFKLNGHYGLMVGVGLKALDEIPSDFVMKTLAENTYLELELQGHDITSDYYELAKECLLDYPEYQVDPSYMIQLYDDRFKGMDRVEESIITAWLPLKIV